jgi:threonine synthase
MKYISTRGQMEPIGFQDAVMTGLSPDGGLLLPESIPQIADRLVQLEDKYFALQQATA